MDIEVLEMRVLDNGKPLKAFADIKIDRLTIRDFRIIKEPKCRAYVTAPQISWRNTNGKVNFKTIITMPDELKWKLESVILAEYQRAKEKENGASS
jgi:DNA-binding cell septation regulator SpoVG